MPQTYLFIVVDEFVWTILCWDVFFMKPYSVISYNASKRENCVDFDKNSGMYSVTTYIRHATWDTSRILLKRKGVCVCVCVCVYR